MASKHYGSLEGPDAMYIKLVSSEGHEFIIKKELALASGTIKAMLTGPGQFQENEDNVIHLKEMKSDVVCKVCTYLMFKGHYQQARQVIPKFLIEPEIVLDLMLAANFLDVQVFLKHTGMDAKQRNPESLYITCHDHIRVDLPSESRYLKQFAYLNKSPKKPYDPFPVIRPLIHFSRLSYNTPAERMQNKETLKVSTYITCHDRIRVDLPSE